MNIRFSGFGGQGIILSGVIFGWAAVLDGINVVQTQSYGSSARGGACKCDVIIDKTSIYELEPVELDILVAFSQPSHDKFCMSLRKSGTLFIDSDLITYTRDNVKLISIPATDTAFKQWQNKIIANIVMLGCVADVTKLVSKNSLELSILKYIPENFHQQNIEALNKGYELASQTLTVSQSLI